MALRRSSYDSKVLTFFSWLGVTQYLPRDVVFATLRTIADIASKGSTIIFDYFDTNVFVLYRASKRMQAWQQLTRQTGDP